MPAQKNDQQNKPSKSYGYGKRPMWQWVLLYVIVGAIVYFIIYWVFFRHGGGYSY